MTDDLARPDTRSIDAAAPAVSDAKGLPDLVGATPLHLAPVPDDRPDAHVVPMLRERSGPSFDIERMSKDELQNVLSSMQAMAAAQLRRFGAAGVVCMVFDETGVMLNVFERPEHNAITDTYVRESVAQWAGLVREPERKKGRRK